MVPRAVGAAEAGDAPHTPLLPRDEPLDVLQRLDLVLRNIAELRGDVEELRGSLQRLAADILGQVRYPPCPRSPGCSAGRSPKISPSVVFQDI